ncbi:MAG: hypothetical protein LBM93_09525, partial [Oscillospiraceae bacterium]|nr:hypothetical protein [Oscillospiraceae bacterium]
MSISHLATDLMKTILIFKRELKERMESAFEFSIKMNGKEIGDIAKSPLVRLAEFVANYLATDIYHVNFIV